MYMYTGKETHLPVETLILAGLDTLESRRAQLTERFFWRSHAVCCQRDHISAKTVHAS